ncbi:fluoride efflux transporter CrcB [Ignavibacteriales bacterium]
MQYFIVALGSALGGILRYWLSNFVYNFLPANFPYGTMIVNFAGSFVIGAIMFGLNDRNLISQEMRLFLTVGFCGGFTTFSTFSLETINLLRNSEYLLAGLNIGLSLIICLAATFLAFVIFSQE